MAVIRPIEARQGLDTAAGSRPSTRIDDSIGQGLRQVGGSISQAGSAFADIEMRRERMKQQMDFMQKKLDQALDTCDDIPHSCALISARDFIALGSLRPHEELRNRGLLMQHDKLIELTAAPQRIIFFSHQVSCTLCPF